MGRHCTICGLYDCAEPRCGLPDNGTCGHPECGDYYRNAALGCETCKGAMRPIGETEMANRETSDALSSLAANVLRLQPRDGSGEFDEQWNDILKDAKSLAGSVLSQDEHKGKREPSAGTSAYEMVAAVETQHIETTETLIHMVAATVLANGYPHRGTTTSFSPADMDEMHRRYEMTATRDGMITTVRITPRSEAETRPPASLYAEQGRDEDEPAEPQVEPHSYERPLWAVRLNGVLHPASDRMVAESQVSERLKHFPDSICQVENRFCYHDDCPAERCNHVPDRDASATI